ncbi:MAG: stage 0 sporulation family protein [Actinobacteria bacterium]|nr:stage 0 sporulation family protein [Actinomycetota bacterium]MDI6831963.1 stage 0 sporulation family protein [Actinomycetota bacterium]
MAMVVGVSVRKGAKPSYFDPDRLSLRVGDEVIVPAAKGVELGRVVAPPIEIPDEAVRGELKKVIRRATDRDRQQAQRNQIRRERALRKCQELIVKHQLAMKLIDIDYAFDGSSITFYFTADGRVDFRNLVRDLASALKTRIELRQIGVRDEARMVGGLGPCGLTLCCASFLEEFHPISIRMAKEQHLPLNPAKISGVCGRLMCCLRYEQDCYRRFLHWVPDIGEKVETERGEGTVIAHDVMHERVTVELESGEKVVLPASWFGPEPGEAEEEPEEGEDEMVEDVDLELEEGF